MMKKWTLLLVGFLLFSDLFAQKIILPSDTKIKAIGRIDKSNPSSYRFDSPGVYFTMKFKGSSSVAVKFKGSAQAYFQAFINGVPIESSNSRTKLFASIGDTIAILSQKLDKKKENVVTIQKRTENLDDKAAEFMGFVIDDKGVALDAETLYKKRKVEFVGNSITCAFGVEGKDRTSKFSPLTENVNLSYAFILARAFDADVQIAGRSGHGIVRNYNDKSKTSPVETTLPKIWERTFEGDKQSKWDFSYKPDLVVINAGTNDYSTSPHPDKSVFIDAYLKLIGRIRAEYGNIPVVCVVGPMTDEPCFSVVKEMVEMQRVLYKDENTYFVGIPKAALDLYKDYGAATHPGGDGHKKMAQIVSPLISTVTGWNYDRSEMDDIKGGQDFYYREEDSKNAR